MTLDDGLFVDGLAVTGSAGLKNNFRFESEDQNKFVGAMYPHTHRWGMSLLGKSV
jgi:hypothetical protein